MSYRTSLEDNKRSRSTNFVLFLILPRGKLTSFLMRHSHIQNQIDNKWNRGIYAFYFLRFIFISLNYSKKRVYYFTFPSKDYISLKTNDRDYYFIFTLEE